MLATAEEKIVFLDFLELKALQAQKIFIKLHMYLRAIRGRKERRKTILGLLPPNLNFAWFLRGICFYNLKCDP